MRGIEPLGRKFELMAPPPVMRKAHVRITTASYGSRNQHGNDNLHTQAEPKKQREFLSRETWVNAAYKTLAERGIDNVKILNLADYLGVTRGNFYWRLQSRDD